MLKNADKRGLKHRLVRIKKPTFILVVAVSLDGKITNGKKEGTEWTSKEDQKFFRGELDRADVVILGRKTFEAIPRPLTPRNRIVFSQRKPAVIPAPARRSPLGAGGEAGIQDTFYFHGTPRELLNHCAKCRWNRVVIAGGTSIYQWFLKHKLVDEMYITVEPIVFGSGKPFLAEGSFAENWTLVSVKKLNKSGTLLLHYLHS
ncbi:MAG: dihydrofolate reductase family protein [bacterium]|nr:dihydrofolate reductase family protein [bacterium]